MGPFEIHKGHGQKVLVDEGEQLIALICLKLQREAGTFTKIFTLSVILQQLSIDKKSRIS